MYVVATFEQSLFLELAITELEQKGMVREQIMAVPLVKRQEPRLLVDTIHRADGLSLFDLASVIGTVGMLLGTVYGYVLKWGPIIWGLIGAVTGFLMGLLIKYIIFKRRNEDGGGWSRGITSEVVVILACEPDKWEMIERILWENKALGLSKIKM